MRLTLAASAGFRFERTLFSHGWYSLPPFEADPEGRWLRGVVAVPGGGALAYTLLPSGGSVVVESPGSVGCEGRALLRRAARNVLNLDLDLRHFYERTRAIDHLAWVESVGAGRLLRAPTPWEDLVKLVLTTNCTWAFTRRMVSGLCERYGERAADGSPAFPLPDALARAGAQALRDEVKTGYRAPHLDRLARDVAGGRVDPEAWLAGGPDSAGLRRELLALPGVGPYVADNLLKLLGRPSGLGLDSWLRARYAEVYHAGRRVTDRTIARRYARLGSWAGLALWCDMTRDWFEGRRPALALDRVRD